MSGLRMRRRPTNKTFKGRSSSRPARVGAPGRDRARRSAAAHPSGLPEAQGSRNPITPRVRFAESADIPRLFSLKWQLAIADRITATIRAAEADWYRAGFGPSGRFAALVAEIDGWVVGMLTFHEHCDVQYQSTLYIEDLFVVPAYRKLGVASALLADLAALARKRDMPRIELHVREDNRAARRLYRELGFERRHGSIITVLSGAPLLDCATAAVEDSKAEPIEYRVRLAIPNDAARLFQLRCLLAIETESAQAVCPPTDNWVRDSLAAAHPRFTALVAESGATIVGMLTFSLRHYTALPQPALAIIDLFVEPAFRRQAVATSLLAALCAHAAEHRYAHIELHLERRNSVARAMSRRLGFLRVRNCVGYLLAGSPLLQLAEAATQSASLPI
jgi:ribosomal protein S18 acetylase RimI-like enzyme